MIEVFPSVRPRVQLTKKTSQNITHQNVHRPLLCFPSHTDRETHSNQPPYFLIAFISKSQATMDLTNPELPITTQRERGNYRGSYNLILNLNCK